MRKSLLIISLFLCGLITSAKAADGEVLASFCTGVLSKQEALSEKLDPKFNDFPDTQIILRNENIEKKHKEDALNSYIQHQRKAYPDLAADIYSLRYANQLGQKTEEDCERSPCLAQCNDQCKAQSDENKASCLIGCSFTGCKDDNCEKSRKCSNLETLIPGFIEKDYAPSQ